MKLLLDTHVAIWAVSDSRKLPPPILRLLENRRNQLHVSAASIWEIAIKFSLGRHRLMPFSGTEAASIFVSAGYDLVSVIPLHAAAIDHLSMPAGDPFDRLILAQALFEGMNLVTHDERLAGLDPSVISW